MARLQHPITKHKVQVRYGELSYLELLRDGYVDVTPPRSQAQIAASERFKQLGDLHRTTVNLINILNTHQDRLTNLQEFDMRSTIQTLSDLIASLKQNKKQEGG